MKLSFITLLLVGVILLAAGTSCRDHKSTVQKALPDQVQSGKKAQWLTSFDEARAMAAKRNVMILADFTGSDWCRWCIRLEDEVFSRPEFIDYAETNLVLLRIDFPQGRELDPVLRQQNEWLARQFAAEKFPTVLLLDATGNELARTGYEEGGAEAYVKHLKELVRK